MLTCLAGCQVSTNGSHHGCYAGSALSGGQSEAVKVGGGSGGAVIGVLEVDRNRNSNSLAPV